MIIESHEEEKRSQKANPRLNPLEFQVKVTASGLVEKETKRALMRELLRRRFNV